MTGQEAFNKEVKKIIKSQPDTLELIKILSKGRSINDYYTFFDDVGCKLGMSFNAVPVVNSNSFIPVISYKPDNKLNETPKDWPISEALRSYNICYKYLAKEFVYRLKRMDYGVLREIFK